MKGSIGPGDPRWIGQVEGTGRADGGLAGQGDRAAEAGGGAGAFEQSPRSRASAVQNQRFGVERNIAEYEELPATLDRGAGIGGTEGGTVVGAEDTCRDDGRARISVVAAEDGSAVGDRDNAGATDNIGHGESIGPVEDQGGTITYGLRSAVAAAEELTTGVLA